MVSLQDSHSNSARFHTTRPLYTLSPYSKTQWSMGRSMRTVRSNFNKTTDHNNSGPVSENLTDSVIDIRLNELATQSGLAQAQAQAQTPPETFLDLSQAFSDFSACSSDISGELHRLASTPYHDPLLNPNTDEEKEEEEPEPCPGFLERETFSTEIIESISPEDLLPTVKLCISGLQSSSVPVKRSAAAKLRLLAKNRADNRALIGESGAVPALIDLLRCTDPWAQEHSVTALLNLSLHDDNKKLISDPVSIKALIYVLKSGTEVSKQNAACALLNLALIGEETKMSIGACGAIPPLVSLLINGSTRGKKDALTTLYKVCTARVNKERAVSAGAVVPLVGMVAEQGNGLAEKAMVVLSSLAGIEEGREAIVEEGGIAALVEALEEDALEKGKEFAVMILLQLCGECARNRALLIREGGIPPLAALSQSRTLKSKHKAETLLRYLREPRQEASTSTSS